MSYYKEIKSILVKEMEIEEEIVEDTSFTDDLGIDSIEIVELGKNVNKKFGVNISLEEILRCDNINDIVNCIKKEKNE